ncbi:MAG: hypothetical protein H8D46_01785 [FCB group bacterium]|nr:hypothetical protein [FCB group bacterium]
MDLYIGDIDRFAGIMEIRLNNYGPDDICGFQFILDGLEITAIEGISYSQPVSFTDDGQILGFSMMCGDIPVGDYPLMEVSFADVPNPLVCMSEPVFADESGISVLVNLGPCHDFCSVPGDMNGDGMVNVLDIVGFVTLLIDPPIGGNAYFICDQDVNQDGSVDILDIVVIVSIILAE